MLNQIKCLSHGFQFYSQRRQRLYAQLLAIQCSVPWFPQSTGNMVFDQASLVAIWELKHWRDSEAQFLSPLEKKHIIQIQCDECKSIHWASYNISNFLMLQFPHSNFLIWGCPLTTASEIWYGDVLLSSWRGRAKHPQAVSAQGVYFAVPWWKTVKSWTLWKPFSSRWPQAASSKWNLMWNLISWQKTMLNISTSLKTKFNKNNLGNQRQITKVSMIKILIDWVIFSDNFSGQFSCLHLKYMAVLARGFYISANNFLYIYFPIKSQE